MGSMITILHPGVEAAATARPQLAPRLPALQGRRLALLDNGKVNGGALLAAMARQLQRQGVGEVRTWKKQHAAEPAKKLIPELLRWKPDFALTAVGD